MVNWETAPLGLRELRTMLGAQAAVQLAHAYQAKPLYVPRNIEVGHPLVRLLGPDLARRLVQERGGERITIPGLASLRRQLRDDRIRSEHGQGVSLTELAQRYTLTLRRITQIVKGGVR